MVDRCVWSAGICYRAHSFVVAYVGIPRYARTPISAEVLIKRERERKKQNSIIYSYL